MSLRIIIHGSRDQLALMLEANLSDSSGSWMADVKEATKEPKLAAALGGRISWPPHGPDAGH